MREVSAPTHVLLISRAPITGEAIAGILTRDRGGFSVDVADAQEPISGSELARYDVVLLDIVPPEGPLVAKRLLACDPRVRIVAYGVDEDEKSVRTWVHSGVVGCVGVSSSPTEFVRVLVAAAIGDRSCSDRIARSLLVAAARLTRTPDELAMPTLTVREQELLNLLSYGWSNKQIAKALGIELATVKNHLHNTYQKLGVHSRVEARWYAQGRPSDDLPLSLAAPEPQPN